MSETHDVQDFYQRYPYPPPVADLDKYQGRWDDARRRSDHHLFWPAKPYRGDHSILIAGCGTSQAAKHAMRWPEASVTGIDVSSTGIDSTLNLKQKYGLHNLELHQLAVERAGDLGRTFDQVVCTGVLHHLPDPDAGLRALRGVLAADGAMQLMVYAPYGRAGVYMLQQFCRMLDIVPSDTAIKDLITALDELPVGHPLRTLLRSSPELYDEAAIADALLNPLDRAYSVPQLFKLLADNGMSLVRWIKQAAYSPHCGAIASIPQSDQLARLAPVEQYAAIELFRGTMTRHSIVAYRNDAGGGFEPTELPDEAWRDLVPIRLPDTLSVTENLPAGASAVLINPGHTFRDIYLPVSQHEKQWFDRIDGSRTIGEISETLDSVRPFFIKLWLYDQIVFDASRIGAKLTKGDT